MKKLGFFCLLSISIAGCAHDLRFVNRATGEVGTAKITTAGNKSGDVVVALGGKVFSGTWVYAPSGGAVGFSSGTARLGLATANVSSTMTVLPWAVLVRS